jgi:hypothetical protein
MQPDGSTGRIWRTPDAVHIDVRGLQPPGPMVAILRLIDGDMAGAVIIAHLDREPIFLYPELDDRGWRHEIVPCPPENAGGDQEVILRMTRQADR